MTRPIPHSFVPDPQNGRLLRDAFGRFATGVTVVTAATEGGCAAMTANSFSSISMDPPLVMWSPALASSRFPVFAQARHFARNRNALDHAGLSANAYGVPVLDRCLARFDCDLFAMHEAGDHMIIVGRVLHAQITEGDPLAFFGGQIAGIARG